MMAVRTVVAAISEPAPAYCELLSDQIRSIP
jgi:hypothetical protein